MIDRIYRGLRSISLEKLFFTIFLFMAGIAGVVKLFKYIIGSE